MAYKEKRGKYFRGRYKLHPSMWDDPAKPKYGTISEDENGLPFLTGQAALNAANDKEAEIRRLGSAWIDPRKGEVTLAEWVDKWWTAQDLEETSEARVSYLIRTHILPKFGKRTLNSLDSPEDITAWELKIQRTPKQKGRGTYSKVTAKDARDVLSLILGDAKEARLISFNPAERRRHRGRKRNRITRRSLSQEREWATPLETLLIAERAALLSGRDDDFIMVATLGWTGMRWGETNGLDTSQLTDGRIDLDWQLRQLNARFSQVPPKDDSARRIDLPPFLTRLLATQAGRSTRCRCPGHRCEAAERPASARYLFMGPSGGHMTRTRFSELCWHAAVHGATHEERDAVQPRPVKPVLVDAGTGLILRPAWPYAPQDPAAPFDPPGAGRTKLGDIYGFGVQCPTCTAPVGRHCLSAAGKRVPHHKARRLLAEERGVVLSPASWVPIRPGLTPHGLRHSHQTWLSEAKIDKVLLAERLGHTEWGMQAHYTHISPGMRAELLEVLEALWWGAVEARVAMDAVNGRRPGSAVRVLDAMIRARREKANQDRLPEFSHKRENGEGFEGLRGGGLGRSVEARAARDFDMVEVTKS